MSKNQYQWKDPSGIARAALITLWLQIAYNAVAAAIYFALGDASYYDEYTVVLSSAQMTAWVVDVTGLPIYLAGVVTAGMWIWRINSNCHAFHPKTKHTPIGCLLWYIVPFANLVMPYECVREAWDVSSPDGETRKAGKLVLVWWLVYLLCGIVAGVFAAVMSFSMTFSAAASGISLLFSIPSAFLYALVVRRLTSNQKATYSASVFSEDAETVEPNPA